MKHNNKVLIFSPHPDDEVLGCGGSIAKMVKMERTIHADLQPIVTTNLPAKAEIANIFDNLLSHKILSTNK